jgi:hypothetical protein
LTPIVRQLSYASLLVGATLLSFPSLLVVWGPPQSSPPQISIGDATLSYVQRDIERRATVSAVVSIRLRYSKRISPNDSVEIAAMVALKSILIDGRVVEEAMPGLPDKDPKTRALRDAAEKAYKQMLALRRNSG